MESEDAYPAHDFPWTMYFNGHPMPRWAGCWHLIGLLERAEKLMEKWDGPVDFRCLWRLHCRIDHVGIVESEEPQAFRVCCLAFIYLMLRDEAEILEEMSAGDGKIGVSPSEVFMGVRDGLFAMCDRSQKDGLAFWNSGYETDREELIESIRRHLLPPNDSNWLEAPHVTKDRSEARLRLQFMRRDIVALLGTRSIPKEVRRLIHELPKES